MGTPLLIAIVVAAIGVIGTLLPMLPGLPLVLLSIIVYAIYNQMHIFSTAYFTTIIVLGLLGIISEYLLAYIGAKLFGASKYAIIGAVLGSTIGVIFFPPIGLILGAFSGSVLGEFYFTKDLEKSLKAAGGTVLGLLGGTVFRFLIALTIFIMFIVKI